MKPKNPTDAEVAAEMEQIEHAASQKMMDDDARGELAFIRLLRSAFTEFLEGKPWVKDVGSYYWPGTDCNEGRFGLRFTINVEHPHITDLDVTIRRGPN